MPSAGRASGRRWVEWVFGFARLKIEAETDGCMCVRACVQHSSLLHLASPPFLFRRARSKGGTCDSFRYTGLPIVTRVGDVTEKQQLQCFMGNAPQAARVQRAESLSARQSLSWQAFLGVVRISDASFRVEPVFGLRVCVSLGERGGVTTACVRRVGARCLPRGSLLGCGPCAVRLCRGTASFCRNLLAKTR